MVESDELDISNVVVKVVGVGGAGICALESIISASIFGITCIAVDSDVTSLNSSSAPVKIMLDLIEAKCGDANTTQPLTEIRCALQDTDMVILVAGMGGETGTGAIQVIAEMAKSMGIDLIIGIVTLPSYLEDEKRTNIAEDGILKLIKLVTSLIVIPTDGNTEVSTTSMKPAQLFTATDVILVEAVRGISSLILPVGLMALDIADIKCAFQSDYPVSFGYGEASGDNRALNAINKALQWLSRGGINLAEASGVLVNITGSTDMTMNDYNIINRIIHENAHEDCTVKIGVNRDDDLEESIRASIYTARLSY